MTETMIPVFGGDYSGLANDPLVGPILPTLDGYMALVDEMKRIEESARTSTPTTAEVGGLYSNQGVEMVLTGESVADIARKMVAAEDEQRLQNHIEALRKTALARAQEHARVWLNDQLPTIISAVDERLQSVVAEARLICDGPLRGGVTTDHIVSRPELVEPFTRLTELSRAFGQIERLVRFSFVGLNRLTETGPFLPRPWMLSHIIRDYESAWPDFWLSVSLTIQDRSGNVFGTLEGRHNPLAPIEERPFELLRWIAEHHVDVFIPRNLTELRDHRKSIEQLWEQRRNEATAQGIAQRRGNRG